MGLKTRQKNLFPNKQGDRSFGTNSGREVLGWRREGEDILVPIKLVREYRVFNVKGGKIK